MVGISDSNVASLFTDQLQKHPKLYAVMLIIPNEDINRSHFGSPKFSRNALMMGAPG